MNKKGYKQLNNHDIRRIKQNFFAIPLFLHNIEILALEVGDRFYVPVDATHSLEQHVLFYKRYMLEQQLASFQCFHIFTPDEQQALIQLFVESQLYKIHCATLTNPEGKKVLNAEAFDLIMKFCSNNSDLRSRFLASIANDQRGYLKITATFILAYEAYKTNASDDSAGPQLIDTLAQLGNDIDVMWLLCYVYRKYQSAREHIVPLLILLKKMGVKIENCSRGNLSAAALLLNAKSPCYEDDHLALVFTMLDTNTILKKMACVYRPEAYHQLQKTANNIGALGCTFAISLAGYICLMLLGQNLLPSSSFMFIIYILVVDCLFGSAYCAVDDKSANWYKKFNIRHEKQLRQNHFANLVIPRVDQRHTFFTHSRVAVNNEILEPLRKVANKFDHFAKPFLKPSANDAFKSFCELTCSPFIGSYEFMKGAITIVGSPIDGLLERDKDAISVTAARGAMHMYRGVAEIVLTPFNMTRAVCRLIATCFTSSYLQAKLAKQAKATKAILNGGQADVVDVEQPLIVRKPSSAVIVKHLFREAAIMHYLFKKHEKQINEDMTLIDHKEERHLWGKVKGVCFSHFGVDQRLSANEERVVEEYCQLFRKR